MARGTRAALFLNSLRGGGAERCMVTVANGLAERGHAVDLVLGRARGPYLAEVSGKVRTVDLATRSPAIGVLKLCRYMRSEAPTAVMASIVMNNIAVACVGSLFPHVRTVLRVGNHMSRDSPFHNAASKAPNLAIREAYRLVPMLYPRADGLVAVSQGVADDLVAHFRVPREKISVILNPVITPDLEQETPSPPHPWYTEEPPVLLAAGRMEHQKDYPTLLRAFAAVRRRLKCRLIVLGDGPLRACLEQCARDLGIATDVSMPGFVVNPFAFMRYANVFVLSSAWEGLPNVLVQAMACGCALVSTDCPSGPAEILDHGRHGHLTPVGDHAKMADAIVEALACGRAKPDAAWLARFGVETAIARYADVLGLENDA